MSRQELSPRRAALLQRSLILREAVSVRPPAPPAANAFAVPNDCALYKLVVNVAPAQYASLVSVNVVNMHGVRITLPTTVAAGTQIHLMATIGLDAPPEIYVTAAIESGRAPSPPGTLNTITLFPDCVIQRIS